MAKVQIFTDSTRPFIKVGESTMASLTTADILALSSLLMAASGASACVALLGCGLAAPYGRYSANKPLAQAYSCGLPHLPARLAWLVQECPSFLVAAYMLHSQGGSEPGIFSSLSSLATPRGFLAALFLAHYFNRGFVYPLRISGGKPTPFGICLMAFVFCLWNGWMQGQYLASLPAQEGGGQLLAPRVVCGVLLFVLGMGINLEADDILRNLRGPGETGYKIPRGGAFEWVSGANFFGECLEWLGFALAAYQAPTGLAHPALLAASAIPGLQLLLNPAVAFALFTCLNIGPRAIQHHENYKKMFGTKYPSERKAIIPLLL